MNKTTEYLIKGRNWFWIIVILTLITPISLVLSITEVIIVFAVLIAETIIEINAIKINNFSVYLCKYSQWFVNLIYLLIASPI